MMLQKSTQGNFLAFATSGYKRNKIKKRSILSSENLEYAMFTSQSSTTFKLNAFPYSNI